jgi:hypothetical protein
MQLFCLIVCFETDFNPDPESSSYKTMLAWYGMYWLHIAGMIVTALHISRKKFDRVTKLHIFTSTSSLLYTWVLTRYVHKWSIDIVFILFGTGTVHFYYMLSSMGNDIRPYLWWKQHLTIFQTAQGLFTPIKNKFV